MKKTVYLITRKDPITGYNETIQYTGNIKQKPKKWRIVKQIEG